MDNSTKTETQKSGSIQGREGPRSGFPNLSFKEDKRERTNSPSMPGFLIARQKKEITSASMEEEPGG